jgi:hypothetical protein
MVAPDRSGVVPGKRRIRNFQKSLGVAESILNVARAKRELHQSVECHEKRRATGGLRRSVSGFAERRFGRAVLPLPSSRRRARLRRLNGRL